MLTPQTFIEQELRERLAEHGVKVEWGHRLLSFEPNAASVTAAVESGGGQESVRADWLAGCDGGHSIVRKLTGVGFPGNPVLEKVLLADVRADWPMTRTGSVMVSRGHRSSWGCRCRATSGGCSYGWTKTARTPRPPRGKCCGIWCVR